MTLFEKFKANAPVRKIFVLLSIVFLLFLLKKSISIILLTFIFTVLINRFVNAIQQKVKISSKLIVIFTYALIVLLVYLSATKYLPKLATQTMQVIESIYLFYVNPANQNNFFVQWIGENLSNFDIRSQIQSWIGLVFNYISNIGSMGMTFMLSFILSFFFSVDKKEVSKFSKLFLNSKIDWYAKDLTYFGSKFINTFGVVIEAQFLIAVINTILTTIALYFLKMPSLFSLSLMIFMLSLIPVAGVIISCIPLSLIGYSIGGIQYIIYLIIIITVIHAAESYFLNPKLMSSKTELPIFYTFVILIFSQKFFGVWGLIIGIPTVMFLLDILDVKAVPDAN